MDVREKLVELVKLAGVRDKGVALSIADCLVINGVTVQEWISVKDRLPETETEVLVFRVDYVSILTYGYNRRGNLCFKYMDECGYWRECFGSEVTHWMPLPKLPQPPKGE